MRLLVLGLILSLSISELKAQENISNFSNAGTMEYKIDAQANYYSKSYSKEFQIKINLTPTYYIWDNIHFSNDISFNYNKTSYRAYFRNRYIGFSIGPLVGYTLSLNKSLFLDLAIDTIDYSIGESSDGTTKEFGSSIKYDPGIKTTLKFLQGTNSLINIGLSYNYLLGYYDIDGNTYRSIDLTTLSLHLGYSLFTNF